MEEKKLTDNEIVKAVEYCSRYDVPCNGCPVKDEPRSWVCKKLLIDILDLIRRLQTENAAKDKYINYLQRKLAETGETYRPYGEWCKDENIQSCLPGPSSE